MMLSTAREERQMGEHIIPAQPPNWNEVFRMGTGLLEKSRDLRILIKVCQAALHKYGLPGLAQGLTLMAQWIENDWDYLYPLLETDGDHDPLFRSNVISEISDREGLVYALQQATFLETSVGAITVFVAEQVLEGKQEENSLVSSSDQLSRMLIAEKDKNRDRLVAISSISSSLASLNSTLKLRFESEYWPNIDLVTRIVARLDRFVAAQLQEEASTNSAPAQADENMGIVSAPRASAPLPSSLNTRADAYKALALAREYFEHYEPSHPAPLLIRRIERIGGSDFFAIIQELMPDATGQVRLFAGES
ncbi:MAG: type VI secretion system ImpA family N-terminal domain-containing protein [Betaproteobacteria bacterium]|nr:type VI secretion system ImpA family N-terminal domain-containing protein [Betaproteobacteria bacterium]